MSCQLTRTLQVGSVGADVEGCKRAVYRYLTDGPNWDRFVHSVPLVRRTFGPFFRTAVKRAQAKMGLPQTGAIGPATFQKLRTAGAFDALACDLLDDYAESKRIRLCYPHYEGDGGVSGPIHPTDGLSGNWAIDFMAPGGSTVVASFDCVVQRFSGRDPKQGVYAGSAFGWSMYLGDDDGRTAFLTHFGTRSCSPGQKLKAGTPIGTVGHWPHDPGRSHTHEGISSPKGSADARARITAIAAAKKLPPL
jgi:murein DD-endopeptidase MepM/ murein hydrolase activator NlpD